MIVPSGRTPLRMAVTICAWLYWEVSPTLYAWPPATSGRMGDELKIGLLGGMLSQATLTKLQSAAGFLKGSSGDDGLDTVLGEIELRVEVEIAKMAPR